jgi:hypothetical protein
MNAGLSRVQLTSASNQPMQPSRILPDLQCSLVCQDIRIEANGSFILIGVMDVVRVAQVPVTAFVLQVFNRWTAGVGQFVETVRLLGPDQTTVLHKGGARFGMRDPNASATTVTPFRNVEFTVPGPYYIEVLVDDVMKVRYPIHLVVVPPPQTAGQTAPSKPEPARPEPPPADPPA